MWFSSWKRNAKRSASDARRHMQTASRQRATFRPQLETLEGRDVPSTLTVTNNLDSGAGSLRADIAAANPGDTINFAPSLNGQTITLTSGQLVIYKSLSIQGPGAGELAISGGNTSRVFDVDSSANVLLSGLTITQGNGEGDGYYLGGGGIANTGGSTLTISGCTLSNNRAFFGGGVYNWGATPHLVDSTLSGNRATSQYGLYGGGGIYSVDSFAGSPSTVTGCTFTNNTASSGGGICLIHATMRISDCTFSGNIENYGERPTGNDIFQYGGAASALTVSDSIFSNNTPDHFSPILGPWTNGGGNTFNYN